MKTSSELRLEIYLTSQKLKKAEKVILVLLKKMDSSKETFEKDVLKLQKAREIYHNIGLEIQELNYLLTDTKVLESAKSNLQNESNTKK